MAKKKEEIKEKNIVVEANNVTETRKSEIKKDGLKVILIVGIIAIIYFIIRLILVGTILTAAISGIFSEIGSEIDNNKNYHYDEDDEDYDYDYDYDIDDFGALFENFGEYFGDYDEDEEDIDEIPSLFGNNKTEENKTRKDSDYKNNQSDNDKDVDRFSEFYQNAQEKNNKKK